MSPRIASVEAVPLDFELTEPFGIASGTQLAAHNVLVRLTLDDGTLGLGEAAPFPAVSGETQAGVLSRLAAVAPQFVGLPAFPWLARAREMKQALGDVPSAACGLEMALLDADCRAHGESMWRRFGAREPRLQTDITIVTGSSQHAEQSALRAVTAGFETLKVKVGGVALDHDLSRLLAIIRVAPEARLLLDGNGGFSAPQALALLAGLGVDRARVCGFEQPTPADDWEGMRHVRAQGNVPVIADESARSVSDVDGLARERVCDSINLKIMKAGIAETLDMLASARVHGLGVMIGGMVESKLAMTVSACLAAGQGGFCEVDLDTPLFLKDDQLQGGWSQRGRVIEVDRPMQGHGIALRSSTGDAPVA